MRTLASLIFLLSASRYASAQTATDGSVGPAVRLDGQDIEIGATLGSRRGDNLFHSFETFNIPKDGSATFTGPAEIRNVISRVTGGDTSTIEGVLRSEVGSEGFFLINPAGVVISEGASIDVPGTFHVSDAARLEFADGTILATGDASDSSLTLAAPEAFGFLAPGGGVAIEGARLEFKPGQSLNVTASTIQIGDSNVLLYRGDVRLYASESSLPLGHIGLNTSAGGTVEQKDANLSVTDGVIAISSGALDLNKTRIETSATDDNSSPSAIQLSAEEIGLTASIVASVASGDMSGGEITITGQHIIARSADGVRTVVRSASYGAGNGGEITVKGDVVALTETRLRSISRGAGAGGDLYLDAGRLRLNNTKIAAYNVSDAVPNYGPDQTYLSDPEDFFRADGDTPFFSIIGGDGNVGSVQLVGDEIKVSHSVISTNTAGAGDGGNIILRGGDIALNDSKVRATNRNSLTRDRLIDAYAEVYGYIRFEPIQDDFVFGSDGDVGSIMVKAGTITLNEGEFTSQWYGRGRGGALNIEADELVGIAPERNRFRFDGCFSVSLRRVPPCRIELRSRKVSSWTSTRTVNES